MWFADRIRSKRSSTMPETEADTEASAPFIRRKRKDNVSNNGPSARNQRPRWVVYLITAAACMLVVFTFALFVHDKQTATRSSGCANPARRREWRTLSDSERAEYISAVKCLHDRPSVVTGQGRRSDDFPWIHKRIGEITHYAAPFLPWHRYFIHLYEQALRESCGYRGHLPYWDWTRDWKDPTKSPIWDPSTGFGGDGTSGGDASVRWGTCIAEGPFAGYEVHWYNRTSRPHCLSRGFGRQSYPARFSGDAFSPAAMAETFSKDRFIDFSMQIEIGPHNSIPMSINGDFMLFEAPNDPVFFLHHAQVDRLWWTWQTKAPRRALEYNGPKEGESKEEASLDDLLPMHGLGPDLPVRDMMSTRDGLLCYAYE